MKKDRIYNILTSIVLILFIIGLINVSISFILKKINLYESLQIIVISISCICAFINSILFLVLIRYNTDVNYEKYKDYDYVSKKDIKNYKKEIKNLKKEVKDLKK